MSGFESEPLEVRRDLELDDALTRLHGSDWAQTRNGVWVVGRDQREATRAGERVRVLAEKILPELETVTPTGPTLTLEAIQRMATSSVITIIYAPETDPTGVNSALNAASLLERAGGPGRCLPRLVATPAASVVGHPRIKLTTGDGGKRPSVDAIVEGFDADPRAPHLDWDFRSVESLRLGIIAAVESRRLMVRSGTEQASLPTNGARGTNGGGTPQWAIFPRRKGGSR